MEYNYPHISDADVQWEFEGVKYDLDLTDDEVREHFTKCARELSESKGTTSRELAQEMRHFFDKTLGIGTGNTIIGTRSALRRSLNCKNSIIAYAKSLTEKVRRATEYGKEFTLS